VTDDRLVTVVIPSYNHAPLLPQAVESVLGQDYAPLEVVVFDDGSGDGSLELARGYAEHDERVRVLTHPDGANRGIAATLNAAYEAARGVYVAALAADDVLFPGSVARRAVAIERRPDVGFVYGRIELLDRDGERTGSLGGADVETICAADATDDPLQALVLHCFVPSPTVLVRRELLGRVGGFDERCYYNDWELWIRLLAHARTAFVGGDPLVGCRPGAYGDEHDLPRRLELYRLLADDAPARGARLAEPRIVALLRLQRALHAALAGEEAEAAAAARAAFEADAALRGDPDYVLWWLARQQPSRLPWAAGGTRRPWLDRLRSPRPSLEAVVAAGAASGSFGCWLVEQAGSLLSPRTLGDLRWGVVANEVEASAGGRPVPALLAGLLLRAARSPGLLRERWYAKAVLCAAGLWRLALRLRARRRVVR